MVTQVNRLRRILRPQRVFRLVVDYDRCIAEMDGFSGDITERLLGQRVVDHLDKETFFEGWHATYRAFVRGQPQTVDVRTIFSKRLWRCRLEPTSPIHPHWVTITAVEHTTHD